MDDLEKMKEIFINSTDSTATVCRKCKYWTNNGADVCDKCCDNDHWEADDGTT